MTFLEYLVVGSYVYATLIFGFLYRLIVNDHEHRLRRIERLHKIAPLDSSLDE